MSARRSILLASTISLSLNLVAAHAQQPRASEASAKCAALAQLDLTRTPDAVIQVSRAQAVEPSGPHVGYCEVEGYVAPSVWFALRMPTDHRNGRFIELGCGGACGFTAHVVACDEALRRGYACIVSDGGHKAAGDLKWAYNNPQAVVEYTVRASHVTAIAGKVLVEQYYDHAPEKSYFMGCSAGGLQATMEAERFPWDFDGIIAGAPSLSLSHILLNWLWNNRAITGADGNSIVSQTDLETLHAAVVASCDLNDGVKDGLIGDPRACRFNPSELGCGAGKTGGCLTASQVDAVKKIYGGPMTSKGEQIVAPSIHPGSELTWLQFIAGSAAKPNPTYNYLGDWFRYYAFQPNPGPTWKPGDFDFDRDYKRLGLAEVLDPVNSPDLRRFKANGGKLLSYTGWSDPGGGGVLGYYENVERVMGGRPATQEFYRLFAVPGMNHCGNGEGASTVDWLSILEAWVERGQAPDLIVGAHLKQGQSGSVLSGNPFPIAAPDSAQVDFSRPIYPYPMVAKFAGRGNPNDASSFRPANP
jgi:feruloyl esterase